MENYSLSGKCWCKTETEWSGLVCGGMYVCKQHCSAYRECKGTSKEQWMSLKVCLKRKLKVKVGNSKVMVSERTEVDI